MKPGDFFIGVRQLLGIIIPGFLWIIAASIGVASYDPIENLDRHSWREIIAALFCAYLLGLSLRGLSFRFGVSVSYWFHKLGSSAENMISRVPVIRSIYSGVKALLHKPFQSATLADILPAKKDDPLRTLAHSQIQSMMTSAQVPPVTVAALSEPDFDEISQQYILGPGQLAKRVEEAQAEVELYASSLLPLLLLIAALLRYWEDDDVKNTFFGMHTTAWLVGLLSLFFLLAWKLQLRRLAEQMDWYRMLTTVSLIKKTGEKASETSSEAAKESKGE